MVYREWWKFVDPPSYYTVVNWYTNKYQASGLARSSLNNFFIIKFKIMLKIKSQLILTKEDYSLLLSYLKSGYGKTTMDRRNAEALQAELKKAKLVDKEDILPDVVRLNSIVKIESQNTDEIMELMLVTPDKANIKENRISVMAPIGTALIGFRKGQKVKWLVPAGKRTFTILDVVNDHN